MDRRTNRLANVGRSAVALLSTASLATAICLGRAAAQESEASHHEQSFHQLMNQAMTVMDQDMKHASMTGNPDHFLNFGLGTIPGGAGGQKWTGDYVFNTGNLKLDLLHNFFLESGARMGKIRVYEATQNPVAREMVGYLIVRGGVHQEAYAKALSDLSGVDITKLLPVPEIRSDNFPDAKKYMDKGFHRILYRFSPDDYKEIGEIWNGLQVDTGEERTVEDGPPEGGPVPDLNPAPPLFAPGVNEGDIEEIAKRL